jgi:hypothetical protein
MTEIETEEPDTEGQCGALAGDEGASGATVPAVADAGDERQRLLAVRADLVERRKAIMFGPARDAYGREIERIDRRLASVRRGRTKEPAQAGD